MTGPLSRRGKLAVRPCLEKGTALQIGTTNSNVDDGGKLLTGEALPLATADLLRELLHMLEDVVDAAGTVHDVLAVNLHVPAANVAQGRVIDGTLLREVDLVASEQGIALLLEPGLFGELDEQVDGVFGDQILAEVE